MAYGKDDTEAFTGIDKPQTQQPGNEPYNFYRYNGKRWDRASGSYDMGFRDYNPGLNRFLTRDNYNGTVDATSWHPVWGDAEGRFVNIGDLKPGRHLTSADGTSPTVTDVDRYTSFVPVYDLTIDGVHTYYVLAGGLDFLVHNCGTGKWSSDDPDVGELANAIDDRYPGHVLAVNRTRGGLELDIETANATIEAKGGDGRGLTRQIVGRQGPSAVNPERS
ncbi:RHS repeat-associated core domain-containing protein [Saccharothrix ecbatanensis]|nr:RHS repeat-associated core domain-containing protein [Saccharothrix ecbatanensis]